MLILNEPETSLHADLLSPLADLIALVPAATQVLVVTQSPMLVSEIAARRDARVVELVTYEGETRPAEEATGRRVWTFDG